MVLTENYLSNLNCCLDNSVSHFWLVTCNNNIYICSVNFHTYKGANTRFPCLQVSIFTLQENRRFSGLHSTGYRNYWTSDMDSGGIYMYNNIHKSVQTEVDWIYCTSINQIQTDVYGIFVNGVCINVDWAYINWFCIKIDWTYVNCIRTDVLYIESTSIVSALMDTESSSICVWIVPTLIVSTLMYDWAYVC